MPIQINDWIRLEVAGASALILYFCAKRQGTAVITPEINCQVDHAQSLIRQHCSVEIIDLIPSYASILVVFNLLATDHHQLGNKLKKILQQCGSTNSQQGRLIELPAYYSLEFGMDLKRIAKHAKLTVEQVISLHQGQEYRVYAIGFAPGFAYLGEVDARIAMARLTTPRLKVPKGAIAIADRQTAVYPAQSPGGWNIIGLCPVDMFSTESEPTMPVGVGDRVKFVAIDRKQYLALGGELPNAELISKVADNNELNSKQAQTLGSSFKASPSISKLTASAGSETYVQKLGFVVKAAGVLSLIQDAGRYGVFNLGLTNGGPADILAFYWANRLCANQLNTTAIEISLGGLQLTAQVDCVIAITGAPMPLTLNGKPQALWRSFLVKSGDTVSLGYTSLGVRCYLAVAGGFAIKPSFGSTATVCRESIGGINGCKLVEHDVLPCRAASKPVNKLRQLMLPEHAQPQYCHDVVLHTVLSYQQQHFSNIEKRHFFSSQYQVSKHWDRMGYRLQGRAIKADVTGILSEGICYGAIQVPADGQPIVLLNDRQTIGGYPKIGAVISQDCSKLAQLRQGDNVGFEPITLSQADNLFHLSVSRFNKTKLIDCS